MKHLLIFAALSASAVHAQSDTTVVSAGGPVLSGFGDAWQIAEWRPAPAPVPVAAVQPEQPRFEAPVALEPAVLTAEVLFDFDGDELREEGRKVLDDLTQRILAREVRTIVATAHADRIGGEHYNLGLSARRAHAVRAYLVEKGIPESSIQLDVAGKGSPVSACADLGEESRRNLKLVSCLQPDRRVEIEAD